MHHTTCTALTCHAISTHYPQGCHTAQILYTVVLYLENPVFNERELTSPHVQCAERYSMSSTHAP